MGFVTLGGAALRLTPPGNERLETARTLSVGVSGPECNAAVAAQRLGVDAAWLSRLPDDPLGRRIAGELRAHEVDVVAEYAEGRQGVTFFEQGPSPRGNAAIDDRVETVFDGLSLETLPGERVSGADIAYVSAATPTHTDELASVTRNFLGALREEGATTALGALSVDRAAGTARETLEGLFAGIDVFVGTTAVAEAVFDREGELGPVMHALASTHDFETVALLGESNAAVWQDSTIHGFPLPEVDAVDVTGAADAFAGAFLARLARDGDVQPALRAAIAADALAKTTPGALPAFTEAEVERTAEDVQRDSRGE